MSSSEETFRSRLNLLIQKCRKALRLYTTMGRSDSTKQDLYQEMQVDEWRSLNQDLLNHLLHAIDHPSAKAIYSAVHSLRDRFYSEWRMVEAELHTHHKALITAAENGDFIKAALESNQLVSLKAKMQATQAAHHELQELLSHGRLSYQSLALQNEQADTDSPEVEHEDTEPKMAKVIPLRKREVV